MLPGGLHDGAGEEGGVNNRGGFRRAETGGDNHAFGEPAELRGDTPAHVTLGNDKTGIGAHAPIAPVSLDLAGKSSVKRKAAPRQGIEREACAPIVRQKPARPAGSGVGHSRALNDDHLNSAACKEVAGA